MCQGSSLGPLRLTVSEFCYCMPDAQHMRGVEARRCQQLGVLPQRKRTTWSAEHRMPFLLILSPRQIGMHAKKERLHLQVLFWLPLLDSNQRPCG